MLPRSLKCLVAMVAVIALHCGGKTTIFLGTAPGDATAGGAADGSTLVGSGGLGIGGSLGPTAGCPDGKDTTVSGTVYDPAGKVQLYNVLVYIPGDEMALPHEGHACDETCSTQISAVSAALSDEAGHFQLPHVPAGTQLLVIQIGKWYRVTTIAVKACQDNMLDAGQTHLLGTGQGLPRIAVTTGHSDTLECLLRKIGIDEKEFATEQNPDAHVHMFVGCPNPDADNHTGAGAFVPTLNAGATFPDATTLWSDKTKLARYDMVVMSCEGTQCDKTKDDTMHKNIKEYADTGGRLFLSHDQFVWLKSGPTPWGQTADFVGADRDPLPDGFISQIDETFPKGMAFSKWLQNVHGSMTPGNIKLNNARFSVRAARPTKTQRWIYTENNPRDASGLAVEYLTMNTPVEMPGTLCGRVVFTDLHLLPTEPLPTADVPPFPSACDLTQALSPQELALEFMIFDLSSCLVSETTKPEVPAIVN